MDSKKILAWIIIVAVCILIPSVFFIQFFGWKSTLDLGTISIPSFAVGTILFWLLFFIICGIYYGISQLNKKKKTA